MNLITDEQLDIIQRALESQPQDGLDVDLNAGHAVVAALRALQAHRQDRATPSIVVEPCPSFCSFDWAKFCSDFDWALAHAIEETDWMTGPRQLRPVRPSSSLLDMLVYANAKVAAARVAQ